MGKDRRRSSGCPPRAFRRSNSRIAVCLARPSLADAGDEVLMPAMARSGVHRLRLLRAGWLSRGWPEAACSPGARRPVLVAQAEAKLATEPASTITSAPGPKICGLPLKDLLVPVPEADHEVASHLPGSGLGEQPLDDRCRTEAGDTHPGSLGLERGHLSCAKGNLCIAVRLGDRKLPLQDASRPVVLMHSTELHGRNARVGHRHGEKERCHAGSHVGHQASSDIGRQADPRRRRMVTERCQLGVMVRAAAFGCWIHLHAVRLGEDWRASPKRSVTRISDPKRVIHVL